MDKKNEELLEEQPVEALEESNIVSCTSHGITIDVDKRRLDDVRVYLLISRVQNKRYKAQDKMDAYAQLMEIIFGDALEVADKLAEANNGTISLEDCSDFFGDILEQVGAKNS